jgi:hypothetical protein
MNTSDDTHGRGHIIYGSCLEHLAHSVECLIILLSWQRDRRKTALKQLNSWPTDAENLIAAKQSKIGMQLQIECNQLYSCNTPNPTCTPSYNLYASRPLLPPHQHTLVLLHVLSLYFTNAKGRGPPPPDFQKKTRSLTPPYVKFQLFLFKSNKVFYTTSLSFLVSFLRKSGGGNPLPNFH